MQYEVLILKDDGSNVIKKYDDRPSKVTVTIPHEPTSNHQINSHIHKQLIVLSQSLNGEVYLFALEGGGIVSSAEIERRIVISKLNPVK